MGVPKRFIFVFLCFCINLINYAERTNIGIALLDMGFADSQQGVILSAFYYGYICMQVPSGWAAERFGGARVLLVGVLMWTLCDLATVPAGSSLTLGLVIVARIGMGLGEASNFPCLHNMASQWFPSQERSRMVAFMTSGNEMGTVLSLIISPQLSKAYGWQSIFYVWTAVGAVWWIAFLLLATSRPEDHSTINPAELQYIMANRASTNRGVKAPTPWGALITHKPVIAIFVAHTCFNYGWYVLLGWIPKFMKEKMHLDLAKSGVFNAILPYLAGWIGLMFGGLLADRLLTKHKWPLLRVRRLLSAVGLFAPALFMMLVTQTDDSTIATLFLSLALMFGRWSVSGWWAGMLDVGGVYAGAVMGLSNTLATVPGIVGNIVTGWILDTSNSWVLVFGVASVVYFVGGVIYQLLAGADDISTILAERQQLLTSSSDTYTSDAPDRISIESTTSSNGVATGLINGRRRGSSRTGSIDSGRYGHDVEVVGTPPVTNSTMNTA